MTYTASNMVRSIAEDSSTTQFKYDPDHARVVMWDASGNPTTYYLNDPISGAMEEQYFDITNAGEWRDYLQADGKIVAEHITTFNSSGAPTGTSDLYFTLDNLGSVAVVNPGGTAATAQDQAYVA